MVEGKVRYSIRFEVASRDQGGEAQVEKASRGDASGPYIAGQSSMGKRGKLREKRDRGCRERDGIWIWEVQWDLEMEMGSVCGWG